MNDHCCCNGHSFYCRKALLRSELSERRQKGEARQPKAGKQKGNHSTADRQ